jgi:selenocysteine lyase/cysteine desulfurase
LRQEFPVTRHWSFFDHAAVAPLALRAQRAIVEWAADMAENGDVHEPDWVKRIEDARGLAGRLLNADATDIAFVKNTSEGIGIVAEGYPWRSGDNVVTAAEEYPANIYPWMNLANRGVELRRVPSRDGRILRDDIAAAIDSRTRVLSLSAVEFASGYRNDLGELCELCKRRNVHLFVDAIQSLGVLPFDVRQTPVDFLAADGHKWMLSAAGAGIFYIRRELVDLLHPVGVGWNSVVGARNFGEIDFRLKPHAGRWESGSLNVAGIVALGASLQLLLGIGIPTVASRVLELTDYFCARAEEIGLQVFSSRRPTEKSAIVSIYVGDVDLRALVRRCREAGIVVNRRAGRLRISPHCYNTTDEIDRLITVLADRQRNA